METHPKALIEYSQLLQWCCYILVRTCVVGECSQDTLRKGEDEITIYCARGLLLFSQINSYIMIKYPKIALG
jgi:hypothetical protein